MSLYAAPAKKKLRQFYLKYHQRKQVFFLTLTVVMVALSINILMNIKLYTLSW